MARYLTDLADVLRAAGLTVVEVDGWQTRARSSGGYADGRPSHLMIHHTASPLRTDGWPDVTFIVTNSSVRPVANIYTARTGVVYVCAAGATNTNGQGRDTWGGGVPDDQMNLYAIANEIANDGVGEPYPVAQQAAVMLSSVAICRAYGIGPHCVRGHFEWAPTRKVDPRGPSMWAPNGGKWDMDAFRHDVSLGLEPPIAPPPPPPTTGDHVMLYIAKPTYTGVTAATPWLAVFESGAVRRAVNADVKYAQSAGVPIIDQDSKEQHEYLVAKFGI